MIFRWKKFKNFRLMTKLIVSYFFITVIPLALLGYFAYAQYSKSIEEQVGENIPKLLDQANERIGIYIRDLKQLPYLLYNSAQVIEVLRKDSYQSNSSLLQDTFIVNSYLAKTYSNGGNPDILGVFILSKNRLYESSKVPYTGFESIELPYGQDMELNGKQAIIYPSHTNLKFKNNPPYILLMHQITDTENRQNLGTMFIVVEMSSFQQIIENIKVNDQSELSLMNEYGYIIYHTNPDLIGKLNKELVDYPNINGSFRTTTIEDNRLISISRNGPDEWILEHSVPLKNLTERTDVVRNTTIIVFIIVVILSTIISIFLAWNVARPMNRLTRLMKRVEKGDFDVDLTINTTDEVGILANSFNSMVLEIRELIKINYQIKLQQKEAELYALQSQINPHFMYNTLETIGMAVEEGEDDTVVEMVSILGRMLRFSINNKDKVVTVNQEVQHMKDYLTIQKIRFEERIDFYIQEEVNSQSFLTPKFILQPIVENAIKHGLDHQQHFKLEILIKKAPNKEELIFKVIDNGPGIPEELLEELNWYLASDPMGRRDSKFGLINVHGRIVMMYGQPFGLQLDSKIKQGTEVTIKIPLLTVDIAERSVSGGGTIEYKTG
ncbi:sensor histidine kinase [Neobacillus sp. FSL H8-0543]|uniref:cache domain-containing sensor histidine kinase n=1 Tax=Neobacillus sp. FSL H8-0543 TaxID=2954672 RepID=UPI003158ECBE